MPYRILYACISHPGKVRQVNQDNFICHGIYMPLEGNDIIFPLCGNCTPNDRTLFGIFDGLGGEQCGEVAAHIAALQASSLQYLQSDTDTLLSFCDKANQAICDFSTQEELHTIGTTAAMLMFSKKICLCNIGDSKIFRFHHGKLKQLSEDHICPAPYGVKPPLSQSLGIPVEKATIKPYTFKTNYVNGDQYLICSDGLTDMLTLEEISSILTASPVEVVVKLLLERSLNKGGIDNTTIILCRIEKHPRTLFKRILLQKERTHNANA